MLLNCVVLEKTLKSPLDFKEIQPVNTKGNQSRIFFGQTDAGKLKLQYFSHLMGRTDSFEKTLMLGKTEGEEKGRRMRWLDGITDSTDVSLGKPGVGDGQGCPASYSPWGRKESDTTE